MQFKTHSGSVYQVDTVHKRIRRLFGKVNPTVRQGTDGDWRSYKEVYPAIIQVGQPVIIQWSPPNELPDGSYSLPLTTTSVVTSVEESPSICN